MNWKTKGKKWAPLVCVTMVVCILGCPPSGPTTVQVPNAVGQTQAAATSTITSAGLTLGTVTQAFSDTVASGYVISQSPAAGSNVASGSSVNLTVSKGPENVVTELPTYNFTVDTTLPAGVYLAKSSVSVSNGATLTLSPGVTIQFQQGKQMTVEQNGRLSAVGTAAQPIVLTGEEAIRGYWGGLRFYGSNSLTNQLEHVTIEYGGGYWNANLYVYGTGGNTARVGIVNCTLRESDQYGLYVNGYCALTSFSDNTLTSNTTGAAQMHADSVGYLDDTSTYAGNNVDIVEIWGSSVESAATWPGIDAVYNPKGSIGVNAALTLEPGVQLMFAGGRYMDVNGNGSLIAAGTMDDPIVFTGEEQVRGYWGGVRIYQSNSPLNQLDHVIIEYGGGYWDANLYLYGSSSYPCQVAITNCVFRESENHGLYSNLYATMTAFSGNTLTANTSGAARMDVNCVGDLDDTSTYSGNDYDVIDIWGSTLQYDATWPAIDVWYLCEGSIGVDAALTIAPGANIMFEAGKNMSVSASGSINAVGTAVLPIVFSGAQEVVGYWGGVRIYQSNSPDNRLEYVTLEYGGNYWNANLYIIGSSSYPVQAVVRNCHISDSSTWGILVGNYATTNADIVTANTFANNASGNISIAK